MMIDTLQDESHPALAVIVAHSFPPHGIDESAGENPALELLDWVAAAAPADAHPVPVQLTPGEAGAPVINCC